MSIIMLHGRQHKRGAAMHVSFPNLIEFTIVDLFAVIGLIALPLLLFKLIFD